MSAQEKADLHAMHANEKRLYDQLDSLDEELLQSREKAAQAEADKQNLLDEFEALQTQVLTHSILTMYQRILKLSCILTPHTHHDCLGRPRETTINMQLDQVGSWLISSPSTLQTVCQT